MTEQHKMRVSVGRKGNELLVGLLVHRFDLPGARVMIRRGSHGRTKTVEIYGQGLASWHG